MRERVRYLHCSLQTEKANVYWAKAFVLWAARSGGGFRHPREMGQAEIEGFLTMLATENQLERSRALWAGDRAAQRNGVCWDGETRDRAHAAPQSI